MPLTDTTIRNAKPADKPYKIYDGGGLYIEITPSGGKLWRLKYRYAGKEKLQALGKYPTVSLSEARSRREEGKTLLAGSIDPGEVKRIEKQRREVLAADTFEAVARDWFDRHLSKKAESTRTKVISRMERFVLPYIIDTVRFIHDGRISTTVGQINQSVGCAVRTMVRGTHPT